VKKIATAILIFLLVFNWFGYRLMVDYLQQKVDARLETHLDNNHYNEAELIEIKIAMHLPYQSSRSTYERYDGEVEYNGSFYKYVKRKVANDTLYLKCINNPAKTHLELAKNDFFKNTNEVGQNNNKSDQSKGRMMKKSTADYDDYFSVYRTVTASPNSNSFGICKISGHLPKPAKLTPEQPPEAATLS
jgi:hypothetical protein